MKVLNKQSGFTLLEMLIAVCLLMVGFLGVVSVLWVSSRSGTFSRQMSTAACLNEDVMEQINMLNYSSSSIKDTNSSFVNFPGTNVTATGFQRRIRVQDGVPAANTKTITVRIRWQDGSTTKTRTFVMLKRQDF